MKRILCIRFPQWPLQRLVAAQPELKDWLQHSVTINARHKRQLRHALVIHASTPRRGQTVRACSSAAHEQGVRVGMSLSEATGLFPDERHVRLVEHDPQADLTALSAWAQHCERFSPVVGWQTISGGNRQMDHELAPATEPDTLWLDVAGIEPLFGGEAGLQQAIRSDVAACGWVAHIATASTIGAAWAGTFVRTPEEQTPSTWPVSSLRMPAEALAILASLGVHQIDQLLALPREGLATRLGPAAMLRLDQFLGHAAESIACYRPPPIYSAEWIAENPLENREQITAYIAQLLDRITSALIQKQQGALQLECRIDQEGLPVRLELGLFQSTSCPAHLFELLALQLDRRMFDGPVGRIGIHVRTSGPLEVRQKELFVGHRSLYTADATRLIDRLRSRLGAKNVVQAATVADPLPERAVRWRTPELKTERPATRRRKIRVASDTRLLDVSAVPRLWGQRPILLLPEPALLTATSVIPDGPPILFAFRGKRHRVRQHIGPERIESGWWRGPSIRREYYRVESDDGAWFWLFRDRSNGRWFLHGIFE